MLEDTASPHEVTKQTSSTHHVITSTHAHIYTYTHADANILFVFAD